MRSVGTVPPQKRQCGINGHLAQRMEWKKKTRTNKKEMRVRRDLGRKQLMIQDVKVEALERLVPTGSSGAPVR